MINYYYELYLNMTVFGRTNLRYLAHFDVHPGRANGINWKLHDQAVKHSQRVWLENANGVTLVKALPNDQSYGRIDEQEFTWIKLQCQDIEDIT